MIASNDFRYHLATLSQKIFHPCRPTDYCRSTRTNGLHVAISYRYLCRVTIKTTRIQPFSEIVNSVIVVDANHILANCTCFIMDKFEYVRAGGGGGGVCTKRTKLNKFEHFQRSPFTMRQVCMGVNMNLRMGYCKQILIDS